MFGYLQIHKDELKVKEYEAYKSAYCGLCKQLGRDYSFSARLILSYDCTFYAILLMSLKRSCKGFEDGRCRFNPIKKCKYACCDDDALSKAAAISVISAYYKIIDNIQDSGIFKGLFYRIAKPVFRHWQKKAAKSYPQLEQYVNEMMEAQLELEHGGEVNLDDAAHPTAQMLASVLSTEGKDESERRVLRELGYHIGRWIYLTDAADDYEKDKKHGVFNPFAATESYDTDYIASVLNQSLARAYDAYNLLDIIDFKPIIENMLLYGFPNKQNQVLKRKGS